jgi:hypothetical protein
MSQSHPLARLRTATAAGLVFVALLALASCSSNKKVTNPNGGGAAGSTTFRGTISGNGVSGTLQLTAQTATPAPQRAFGVEATVTMTGTLVITGGATINLTGNYDTSAHTFSVTGGGWTFSGSYTASGLQGTFSGPAAQSGVFTAPIEGAGTDTVVVVTGTFTSTTGGPGGVFNFAIRGTALHGNAWSNGGTSAVPLDGTFTATTGGAGTVSIINPAAPAGAPLATGTLAANGSVSGTYNNGAGDSGNWSGARQ